MLGPSIPDLLIAAIAGLVVLHNDKHFELIGEITGQRTERLGGPDGERDK